MRKEIIAFAVLTCLALASIQTVHADTPVCASNIYGPFISPGSGSKSLSPFNADFITMETACVSAGYTFQITLKSTPSGWMTSTWQPTYATPNGNTKIYYVDYLWFLFDASGNFLGVLHLLWHLGAATNELLLGMCPPGSTKGCQASVGLGGGLGGKVTTLSLSDVSLSAGTVSVTISQSDLNTIFSEAGFTSSVAEWRALAAACHNPAPTGESCTGYITYPLSSLP